MITLSLLFLVSLSLSLSQPNTKNVNPSSLGLDHRRDGGLCRGNPSIRHVLFNMLRALQTTKLIKRSSGRVSLSPFAVAFLIVAFICELFSLYISFQKKRVFHFISKKRVFRKYVRNYFRLECMSLSLSPVSFAVCLALQQLAQRQQVRSAQRLCLHASHHRNRDRGHQLQGYAQTQWPPSLILTPSSFRARQRSFETLVGPLNRLNALVSLLHPLDC